MVRSRTERMVTRGAVHEETIPHEQRALIALSRVPGLGARRIRDLVEAMGSAQAVVHAGPRAVASVPGIGMQLATRLALFDQEASVVQEMAQAERLGARMITLWDESYPFLLRSIHAPPPFLWVRGQLPAEREPERVLAVVGTRRASSAGLRVLRAWVPSLVQVGFTIVSGLAYGIDAAAHRATLEAGGRTVAVLGSGMDRIYPAGHTRLVEEMVATEGAVVSEFPFGTRPDGVNFPRRNRIVSGLALGTLVVEAFESGGALITARLALEQNREVFAVPGAVYAPSSAGTNRLIQRGEAKLVCSVEDILEEFGLALGPEASRPDEVDPASLAPQEWALCRALADGPMHVDSLCDVSGVDPAAALAYLLNLECKGIVGQCAGRQFFLAASLPTPRSSES